MRNINQILSLLEETLKKIEEERNRLKETNRSDPKDMNQKEYEKYLEDLGTQLMASIKQLKEFSRNEGAGSHPDLG